jgi:hypothetical protein
MKFESAETIADAILYEGYVLYPYRASSTKNQFRWQFGVVAPRRPGHDDDGEPWFSQTECLVERPGPAAGAIAAAGTRLIVRVRFLRPESAAASRWLEGVPHAVDL